MDHSKMKVLGRVVVRSLTLALCVTLTACMTLKMMISKPGIHHLAFPEEVAAEYDCAKRKLPFFAIETNELRPSHPKRGGQLKHRFVYVLCPSVPTESIDGKLTTRILHKARALKTDESSFSLEEGRWVINTSIILPEEAAPGAYALDIRFKSKQGDLVATAPFVIE
jgi:hypothetical protein